MTNHPIPIFLFAVPALAALFACSPSNGTAAGGEGASGGTTGAGGTTGTGGTTTVPMNTGGDVPIFDPNQVTPTESCASAAFKTQLLPSNLLFVVDRSGSMKCNLPPITDSATCEATATAADPTQPTKWSVLSQTLSSAFDQLSTVPNVSVGLSFFSADDVCGVQSAPNVELGALDSAHVAQLKGALTGVDPNGRTPIIGATVVGFKHLHQEAQAPGNRFVVLVTDGADSCFDEYAAAGVVGDPVAQLLNVEIPKALSVNIRTFVIGAPGSEPARGLLSKIANAGGTGRAPGCDVSDDPAPGAECHLDMTRTSDFAADLSNALQNITGKAALTCEFVVPQGQDGAEVDTSTVNVDYYKGGNLTDAAAKVELFRDDTKPCEEGANGWQYIENETKIRLCGEPCTEVHADTSAQVVVSVGCEQRSIQ